MTTFFKKLGLLAVSALLLTIGTSLSPQALAAENDFGTYNHDELKTRDLQMQNLSALSAEGASNESVTPQQLEEMKKQIEELKLRQIEANKAMEELDRE